jgi:hypothetical protein
MNTKLLTSSFESHFHDWSKVVVNRKNSVLQVTGSVKLL